MSQSQTFNNVVYQIPVQGDLRWGPALTRYLAALGTYAITPAGGLYTLTADLNLGAAFGLLAAYYKSSASNIASTGILRLAQTDSVVWRNVANSGDLALSVNGSNALTFNGSVLNTLTLPVSVANGGTGLSSTTAYAVLIGGTTTTGPLQTPGVGSAGQVLTSQGPGVIPIWSAAGTGSGTVNTGTANQLAYYASSTNAVSGLTAITASRALASDANGLPVAATTTATELGFVNGVTSAIQTQINTKAPTASPTFTGTVTTAGIAMGATKITGLANGTASTDAVAFGQLFGPFQALVQSTSTTNKSTTSSTFQDTALTASITPTSSSHRIKITVNAACSVDNAATSIKTTIKRGSTNIGLANGFSQSAAPAVGAGGLVNISYSYIDSPATTSATVYTFQIASTDNTNTVEFAPGTIVQNVIILEEIA